MRQIFSPSSFVFSRFRSHFYSFFFYFVFLVFVCCAVLCCLRVSSCLCKCIVFFLVVYLWFALSVCGNLNSKRYKIWPKRARTDIFVLCVYAYSTFIAFHVSHRKSKIIMSTICMQSDLENLPRRVCALCICACCRSVFFFLILACCFYFIAFGHSFC